MMKTSLKTNLGTRNICVHTLRQVASCICIISPYLIYPAILVIPVILSCYVSPPEDPTSLRVIKSKYPSQNDSFWRTFESGVDDVLQFNRPSNIVVMYRPQSEELLHSILQDLSRYMVRKLEATDPIIVEAHQLNESPFAEDYGEVLSKFGEQLRTQHVMIVKNIDKVVGKVAQAFHSLCDEYTPYVEKAVIIFTLKVDEYPDKDHLFVEGWLRNLWTDIEEDTFSPLVTRMLNVILRVNDATSKLMNNELISIFIGFVIKLIPIFIGFVLCLILYLIRRSCTNIAHICYNHPHRRDSIWDNLFQVSRHDQFFLFSCDVDFLKALIKYLQKQLHLPYVIKIGKKDMKNIERYCKKNKKYLEGGCVLLIDNIEEVDKELYDLFCSSPEVKTLLRTYEFPIIYYVTDENTEVEESTLNERFMNILPVHKVFS